MSFHVEPRPSPNCGSRPDGTIVDTIVLHADGSRVISGTLNWIRNPAAKVSYHYVVGRLGHIYECVQTTKRAWHAGVSAYHGRPDCNDYSVGVCFSNDQRGELFTDQALAAGARLCSWLMLRHPAITLDRITTHAAVALPPGRKVDPGPLFDLPAFLERVRREM